MSKMIYEERLAPPSQAQISEFILGEAGFARCLRVAQALQQAGVFDQLQGASEWQMAAFVADILNCLASGRWPPHWLTQ